MMSDNGNPYGHVQYPDDNRILASAGLRRKSPMFLYEAKVTYEEGTEFDPIGDEIYFLTRDEETAQKMFDQWVDMVRFIKSPPNPPVRESNLTLVTILKKGKGMPKVLVDPIIEIGKGNRLEGIDVEREKKRLARGY